MLVHQAVTRYHSPMLAAVCFSTVCELQLAVFDWRSMQRSDYRATAVVALGLVIASLTGFARQAVLASRLGVGAAADTFLVAYILPEFVSVALPIVLTPAFLPLFASLRLREGDTSAWRLAFQISLLLVAVLAVITLLAAVTTPVYLPILAPGFRDEQVSHAVAVSRLMLPAIVLMGLVSLFGPILQVYRRFWRPALGTGAFNVGFAATLLAPYGLTGRIGVSSLSGNCSGVTLP